MKELRLRLDLSISIVNWNTKDLLRDCLKSIYENTHGIDYEIFVADNASTDGSSEMVEREFPQVKLIKNKENVGFAKANNQIIKESRANFVLLLNPDTVILDNAIGKMVRFMWSHSEVGAVGPKLLNPDGTIQFVCGRSFPTLSAVFFEKSLLSTLFPHNRITGKYYMGYWNHDDTREVDLLSGACMMVRRQTINEVGLMDEQFFMYGEDVDWCYRIKQAGWKIYLLADAQVTHLGGQSVEVLDDRGRVASYQSMQKYFRKYYPKVPLLTLKLLSIIEMILRTLGNAGVALLKREQRHISFRKIKSYLAVLKWHLHHY